MCRAALRKNRAEKILKNYGDSLSSLKVPDRRGHFGPYGGMFVPETLMSALEDLAAEYERAKSDLEFQNELSILLRDFAGRTIGPPSRHPG